jgi:hypothetical protein
VVADRRPALVAQSPRRHSDTERELSHGLPRDPTADQATTQRSLSARERPLDFAAMPLPQR